MQNFRIFPMLRIEGHSGLGKNQAVLTGEGFLEEDSGTVLLQVGRVQIPVQMVFAPEKTRQSILRLSPELMQQLGLERREYGYLWEKQQNQLRIGPVAGIMSEVQKDRLKPFKKQTLFFRQILEQSEKCGVLAYVFAPSAAASATSWITGYALQDHQWVCREFPLPDVVYPRHSGYSGYALKARKKLEDRGISFINPPLIGKWKTCCCLQRYADMAMHLPETQLVTSFHQVEAMLQKWSAVFLKPVNGSQGRDIIRVEKGKNDYDFQYQRKHVMRHVTAGNLELLRKKLQRMMKHQTYIVQQPIELLRIHQSVADVRVVVQKNQHGQWQVTGKAFRIGQPGSITSNLSTGGYAEKTYPVLKQRFGSEAAEELEQDIDRLAVKAAACLEETIGSAGEFGMDIGVDRAGKLWLIEANLKPGRQIFSLLGDIQGRQRSVQGPLLYARYLAGFETEAETEVHP